MSNSKQLFKRAQQVIPGGVNSPVRAFKGVGGTPLFIKQGRGAYLIDVDDREYIDYVGSWGSLILGHAHSKVLQAVSQTLQKGCGFGAPTALEVELAERVSTFIPSIEMVRFVNSGTECVMSAIRLARGFTKRDKMIKFAGCYHGHADYLLVQAGSGALTLGVPNSLGVPESFAAQTLVAEFNNLENVTTLFKKFGDEIACVIIEPVAGNMNCILPQEGFLQGLRELCDQYGSLLIFDEVMTGFRVALGGAQAYFGVKPDLTTLGKVIGGGFPVGAFGGRRDIMQCLAPLGGVYQAGTLSGHPVAMAAGLKTLSLISEPGFYEQLSSHTQKLVYGLKQAANDAKIPFHAVAIGSMFGLFFTEQNTVRSLQEVQHCDGDAFKRFFHAMLREGVYFAPSAFEAGFMSQAHGDKEIQKTIQAAEKVFSMLQAPSSRESEAIHLKDMNYFAS